MGTYNVSSDSRRRVFFRALARLFMEFLPFVCVLFMWAICIRYLVVGTPHWARHLHTISYMLFGAVISFSWMVFAMLASHFMGFCPLHRHMLGYVYVVCATMYFDQWVGLGVTRPYVQVTYIAIGFLIIIQVCYKLIYKPIIHHLCKKR